MTPLLLVQQLHSAAVTIMLWIMCPFFHSTENGSSPGFRYVQFSLRPCSLCIRTTTAANAMVIAGDGTRNSIANVAADRVKSSLQQQGMPEPSLYCVLHENTL